MRCRTQEHTYPPFTYRTLTHFLTHSPRVGRFTHFSFFAAGELCVCGALLRGLGLSLLLIRVALGWVDVWWTVGYGGLWMVDIGRLGRWYWEGKGSQREEGRDVPLLRSSRCGVLVVDLSVCFVRK